MPRRTTCASSANADVAAQPRHRETSGTRIRFMVDGGQEGRQTASAGLPAIVGGTGRRRNHRLPYHDRYFRSPAPRVPMAFTLSQLRIFQAVVEHGSLRAAARALDLAQSGVTQQLQSLEATLGATLFTRTN